MSTIEERLAIVDASMPRLGDFLRKIKRDMLEEIKIRDKKLAKVKSFQKITDTDLRRCLTKKDLKQAKHITLYGFEKKLRIKKQFLWHNAYSVRRSRSTIGIPELRLCFECDALSEENLHAEIIMVSSSEKMGAIFQRVFTGKPCTIFLPQEHVEFVEKVIGTIKDNTNPIEEKNIVHGSLCIKFTKQSKWISEHTATVFRLTDVPHVYVYPGVSTPEDLIDKLREFNSRAGKPKIAQEIFDKIVEAFKVPTCRFIVMSHENDEIVVYVVCGNSPCKIVGYEYHEFDVGKYTVQCTRKGFAVIRDKEILVSYNENLFPDKKVKMLIVPEFVETSNADCVVISGKCQQKILPLWYTVLR
jgi:hypothetical protein